MSHKNLIDITGKTFGRLTVIKRAPDKGGRGQTYWTCECGCHEHTIIDVRSSHLRNGLIQSCGCLRKEKTINRTETHGMTRTRLYRIWSNMKSRCYNENVPCFTRYGAEGKFVCSEWADSFESFRDWSLTHGYRDDLTIERIDGNKGYTPDNCKWATLEEQANNKRNNHIVEVDGNKMTLAQFARKYGLKYKRVEKQINKDGYTADEILLQVGIKQ